MVQNWTQESRCGLISAEYKRTIIALVQANVASSLHKYSPTVCLVMPNILVSQGSWPHHYSPFLLFMLLFGPLNFHLLLLQEESLACSSPAISCHPQRLLYVLLWQGKHLPSATGCFGFARNEAILLKKDCKVACREVQVVWTKAACYLSWLCLKLIWVCP